MIERQVIVCGGPRCDPTRKQADQLVAGLKGMLAETPDLPVSVVRRLCQSACEHGPTLVVQPDGAWYRCEDAVALAQICQRHLRDGEVVAERLFRLEPDLPGA